MKISNSKKNLRRVSCATVVAVTCVGLTGCRTQVKDVMTPLKDGNYEEAVSIYNEANWKDKERNKFIDEIKEYMSQLVLDYAAETITYEEVIEIISTISDMQVTEIEEDIATTSGSISSLHASKMSYADGVDKLEKGNYAGAIDSFEKVTEDDVNYEEAKKKIAEAEELRYKKIKEDMIKIVENLVKAGDYISALCKIEEFKDTNDREDIDLDKLYDKYVKEYVSTVTKKVESLIKVKDYITALGEATSAKNALENDDLTALYTKIENEYVQMITKKVEELIEEKEYLKAIDVLNEAQSNVVNEKFAELMEKIEAEKPVYLSDLKYQNSSQYELIDSGDEIKDTIGNSYTPNGNLFEMTNHIDNWNGGEQVGYVEYYLGYSYNKLSFMVAVDDISNNLSCNLNVYADDTKVYSIALDRKTVPTEVTVDVSNANYLTIKLEGISEGNNENSIVAIIADGYLE